MRQHVNVAVNQVQGPRDLAHRQQHLAWAAAHALGRNRLDDLDRLAIWLDADGAPGDAAVVRAAADVLRHFRAAVHGGPLDRPCGRC